MSDTERSASTPKPPERMPVCAHDVRGPLRQACCCCGACDHLDFRVTDAAWATIVPAALQGAHVCLRCFDALAAERDVNYAAHIGRVYFVGDRASLELHPVSAIDVSQGVEARGSSETHQAPPKRGLMPMSLLRPRSLIVELVRVPLRLAPGNVGGITRPGRTWWNGKRQFSTAVVGAPPTATSGEPE